VGGEKDSGAWSDVNGGAFFPKTSNAGCCPILCGQGSDY